MIRNSQYFKCVHIKRSYMMSSVGTQNCRLLSVQVHRTIFSTKDSTGCTTTQAWKFHAWHKYNHLSSFQPQKHIPRSYFHNFHLQVFMERWGNSDSLQHLAEQLFLQCLHLHTSSTHKPVLTQEFLCREKLQLQFVPSTLSWCQSSIIKGLNKDE